jgi:hypothetical protein
MPWYKKPDVYICDTCNIRFHNRVALPGGAGQPSSLVQTFGANGGITRCNPCAVNLNRNFLSPVSQLGITLSTTITYLIHGGGNYTFAGDPTLMKAMEGDTDKAMTASGALNLMEHPAYGVGKIREPGAFSGANLRHNALRAWPGDKVGKAMHHVHVGVGGDKRVLFGWTHAAYPNNPKHVQSIKLYIGS